MFEVLAIALAIVALYLLNDIRIILLRAVRELPWSDPR